MGAEGSGVTQPQDGGGVQSCGQMAGARVGRVLGSLDPWGPAALLPAQATCEGHSCLPWSASGALGGCP